MLLSPSCLCCLPGRPLFPCLLVPACLLPPAPSLCLVFCLPALLPAVLVGVCGFPSFVVLGCFVGVAWFLFSWVCLVFLCVGCLCWFLSFASCFCWLRLTSVWTSTFVYSASTCATKALIDHCTCVSVRRLDRFTCTVDFHRSTTS